MIVKANCQHCGNEFEIDGLNRSEFCPQCGKETFVFAQAQQASVESASHPSRQDGESVFLHSGNILVTNTRFTIGAKTFAMRGITSVEVVETDEYVDSNPEDKAAKNIISTIAAVGVIFILCGLFGWLGADFSFWFFVVFSAVGFFLLIIAAVLSTKRVQAFKIVLRTAGGEVTALTNSDKYFVSQIVQALNKSIISLG